MPSYYKPSYQPAYSYYKDDSFNYGYRNFENAIDRQTRENFFQAARQGRRLICQRGSTAGTRTCRLRVDRMMQVRDMTYENARNFLQNERYLSAEDLDIIR